MPFPTRNSRIFDFSIVGTFAVVGLIAAGSIASAARPNDDVVGVVFAPWTDNAAALTGAVSAGARFVRFGGAGFVVVVSPESDEFRDRARQNGALAFVDPKFAGACIGEGTK